MCKQKISEAMAYVVVRGDIVLRTPRKRPMVYTCVEQAYNYAQNLFMHDVCWIETLREHGVELYDMNEVAEKYKNKEVSDGMGQDKTRK
jgi:hypothetical protein